MRFGFFISCRFAVIPVMCPSGLIRVPTSSIFCFIFGCIFCHVSCNSFCHFLSYFLFIFLVLFLVLYPVIFLFPSYLFVIFPAIFFVIFHTFLPLIFFPFPFLVIRISFRSNTCFSLIHLLFPSFSSVSFLLSLLFSIRVVGERSCPGPASFS